MKEIIFKKDCIFKGQSFIVGDKLNTKKIKDWAEIWRLNEKGFIKPLTIEEFLSIKENKKEEKPNGKSKKNPVGDIS